VKRIDGSDDFESAVVVAKFSRQLEQTFVRFDAAVAEKAFAGPDEIHQRLRQASLGLVIVIIRSMDELAGLRYQGLSKSGVRMAKGVDRLGLLWAERAKIPVKKFNANWERYGKSAGIVRNRKMGRYAEALPCETE